MLGIILTGGFAKRMKENTTYTPKPMLTVGGKTILDHIISKIERIDEIKKVYILTNSKFKHIFLEFANEYMARKSKLQIIVIEEPNTYTEKTKLGSIGGLHYFIKTYGIIDDFLIIGGDNFFTFNLDSFITAFYKHKKPIVIIKEIQNKNYLKTLAVAKVKKGKIINYSIKPKNPSTHFAGTMIYVIPKDKITIIDEAYYNHITDPTGKLIELLVKKKTPVMAYIEKTGMWADIGTKSIYKKIFTFYMQNNADFEQKLKI
jgi:glucose-1-phosphate thymidylyltransferase